VDQDVLSEARSARIVGQAVKLANWLGDGKRPLTAGGVLRKPDLPAVGAALGIAVPVKLRTAADIRELNRPWTFGIGAGLISVADGKAAAVSGQDITGMGDAEFLDRWLSGTRAMLAAETPKDSDDSVLVGVITVLELLDGEMIVDGVPPNIPFWHRVSMSVYFVAQRYDVPARNVDLDPVSLIPLLTGLRVAAPGGQDRRSPRSGGGHDAAWPKGFPRPPIRRCPPRR
jgi:hypothetical protein